MKLYEISNEYQAIMNSISDEEGITSDTLNQLEEFEGEFESKAIEVASCIKNLEAEAEAINQAIEQMKKRKLKMN